MDAIVVVSGSDGFPISSLIYLLIVGSGEKELRMEKAKRPKITNGITTRIATGCGNAYITCATVEGKSFEVFCSLGKTGGCASSQMEALTRSITVGLRYGVPIEEYIKQLKDIRCLSHSVDENFGDVWSCPDAVSKVLKDVWGQEKSE